MIRFAFLLLFLFGSNVAFGFVAMVTSAPPDTVSDSATASPGETPKITEERPSSRYVTPHPIRDVDSSGHQKIRFAGPPLSRSAVEAQRPTLDPPTTGPQYLRKAGYHMLIGIALGTGGFIVGSTTGWSGKGSIFVKGLMLGAVGFQLAVPFDLIFAGDAFEGR